MGTGGGPWSSRPTVVVNASSIHRAAEPRRPYHGLPLSSALPAGHGDLLRGGAAVVVDGGWPPTRRLLRRDGGSDRRELTMSAALLKVDLVGKTYGMGGLFARDRARGGWGELRFGPATAGAPEACGRRRRLWRPTRLIAAGSRSMAR